MPSSPRPPSHHRRPSLPRLALPRFALAAALWLAPAGLVAFWPTDAAAAKKSLTVQEMYELGLRYMKRGYHVKALEQFNRVRNYHRDDPFAVKAELAIADVYFQKNEWDQARLAYEDFMRLHPRHEDIDYVVYRMGLSLYKKAPKVAGRDQAWTRQAVNAWSGFDARFPDSDHKDEVVEKLTECRERLAWKEVTVAEFYKRREAWTAVEGRAEGMLRKYPDSEYTTKSLMLLSEAVAWKGDGDRARRVADQLAESDAAAAERSRARIVRIETKLAEQALKESGGTR